MKTKNYMDRVLPYKNKLFRFSLRIVGNVAEAEDVVQEVFIKIWQKRAELDQYKNLEAWCMRLTKNLSIDKLRSKHKRVNAIPEGLDIVGNAATPYQVTESNDTMQQIRGFMTQLPEKQRQTMQLRDIDGMSYAEIAEIMSVTLDQVKVNLFRARKAMKAQILNNNLYE